MNVTLIRRLGVHCSGSLAVAVVCCTLFAPGTSLLAAELPPPEVVSAEFGIFDAGDAQQVAFSPTRVVPHREGQRYGWVIELRQAADARGKAHSVSVREEYLLPNPGRPAALPPRAGTVVDADVSASLDIPLYRRSQVSQRQLMPVDGRIYGEWAVGAMEPAGHRRLQVIVEGVVAGDFEFDVSASAATETDTAAGRSPPAR